MKVFLLALMVGQCINQGMSFKCYVWGNGENIGQQDCSSKLYAF